MEDKIFKIAMLHIEANFMKDVHKVKRLIDIVRGKVKEKNIPKIDTVDDFFEAARSLGIEKREFPRIVMNIFSKEDTSNLPSGLVGDIGEYLGEKKGIGVIPTPVLQRTFFREELSKKMGPSKWQFFFKDEGKLRQLKKQKGI